MTMSASPILWQPLAENIPKTQLYHFITFVEKSLKLTFDNYEAFYDWSIQSVESFWESFWKFSGIKAHQPYEKVYITGETFQKAQWFPGAKLNFAENLLRFSETHPHQTALIAYDETGRRRKITYQSLYEEVAALANALKREGIQPNDRIVGYLPNIPETIIAMLATASLGAIWSSCSPDFGAQGVADRFVQIQPRLLFTTDGQFYHGKVHTTLDKINAITEQVSSLEKIIVIPFLNKNLNLSSKKHTLYTDFLSNNKALTFEPFPFNHPLYILYSSGTTGKPKCIVHGVGGTLIQHLKELMLHTDLTEKDCLFYYTTCGWMMWNWMVSGLATGATLLLYDGSPTWPKPSSLFDIIEKEKVTVFGTSAKYIASLEKEHLNVKTTHDLSHLRCILSTGSPLSPGSFDYVYEHIQANCQLSSISGGTDIISCFALGNPLLPVYRGQLQCRGLGLAVEIYNDNGQSVQEEKGELVCTKPFPCMPIYFWNDASGEQYYSAYFSRFKGVWAHGDYAEITAKQGLIIYGRSDTVLKPGGVRIGTAEIYRQVEKIDAVLESIVIGQDWENDIRVVLFVKLRPNRHLNEALKQSIRQIIRDNASPRHVPDKIIQVPDIPRTLNGKIAELAVRQIVHSLPIKNKAVLANPECLKAYQDLPELRE